VPGEITSALSAGTNALPKLGATPLTGAVDVLDALGIERKESVGSVEQFGSQELGVLCVFAA
jgi:hypothetical protein